jgi:hypothetical protein
MKTFLKASAAAIAVLATMAAVILTFPQAFGA